MQLMKNFVVIGGVLLLSVSMQAQLLSNESITGAALGGLVGGVIGHNHHRQTAEGAAIGAGAGLLLGTLAHQERSRQYRAATVPAPIYAPTQGPVYATSSPRHSRALGGALVGGVIGGVVGHNNNRKTAEGAAIGAGAGLLLGHIADQNARRAEAVVLPVSTYYPGQVVSTAPPMPSGVPVYGGTDNIAATASQPLADVETGNGAGGIRAPIGSRTFGGSGTMQGANRLFGR